MLVNRQRLIRELIAIVIAIPLSVVLRSLQFAPQLSWLELFVLSAFACVTIGQLFFNLRQALQLQEVATIRGWLLYWYPISTVGLIFLLVMLYAHLPSNTSVWGILLLFAMYLGHLTNLERVTAKIIEMQSPIDNASSGGKVTPEQSDPKFQLRLMGAGGHWSRRHYRMPDRITTTHSHGSYSRLARDLAQHNYLADRPRCP